MNSNERALRAMKTLTQFGMIELAAEVAQAAKIRAKAQEHVTTSLQHLELAAGGLREALAPASSASINPALIQQLGRLYHAARRLLQERQHGLAAANEREQEQRAMLARARASENAIERATHAERRRQQLRQEAVQIAQADDLWLQRQLMRELS